MSNTPPVNLDQALAALPAGKQITFAFDIPNKKVVCTYASHTASGKDTQTALNDAVKQSGVDATNAKLRVAQRLAHAANDGKQHLNLKGTAK